MTKYIMQFSKENGEGEYLVIVDEKPTKDVIEDWLKRDVQWDAIYKADLESFTKGRTPQALPTDSFLEVQ